MCACVLSLSLSLSLFLSQLLLAGYSQFVELNTKVKALSGISITLPPKKVFGNKSKEFVAKRREGLQAYLLQLLHHPILQHSLVLKEFVDFRRYCSASLTTLPPPPSHHPLLTTHFSPPTSHHPLLTTHFSPPTSFFCGELEDTDGGTLPPTIHPDLGGTK